MLSSAVVRLQRLEKEDKMIAQQMMLQIVVIIVFFMGIPLWACQVAFKGDYPGSKALERALAEKKR